MKTPEELVGTPIKLDKTKGDLSEEGVTVKLKKIEDLLGELLDTAVDKKYEELIEAIKQEKISWVTSPEFARRILLTGATEEDVEQIREWVLGNIEVGKVHVFNPEDFSTLRESLIRYSRLQSGESVVLEEGKGFYVSGNVSNLPNDFLNNIYVQEQTFIPHDYPAHNSTEAKLSHEMGHQAADGLLISELYKNWNPRFKDRAPDPEYVGDITETDVKIRAMFRCLKNVFDPNHESFDATHIIFLREMLKDGMLEKDIIDLLDHYDDDELVRIANYLPAI